MKKLILLLTLFITSTQIYAQVKFDDIDAQTIFNSNPAKFGFEGVYEILYRSNLDGSPFKWKSQNKKICLYTNSGIVYSKLIDFFDSDYNYGFYKSHFVTAIFKVDLYGGLTYNCYYSVENGWKEDKLFQTTKIEKSDNALTFEINTIFIDKTLNESIMLKKLYSPPLKKL